MKSKKEIIKAPLTFKPIFKEKIWGGSKIANSLKKEIDATKKIGESWEISGVDQNVSIVRDGHYEGQSLNDLIKEFGPELLGTKVAENGDEFPLLIKFLDANTDLSVQVHPNDELAAARHNCLGKTEMWYIMEAEKDAVLYDGFSEEMSADKYKRSVEDQEIMNYLNHVPTKKDDVFFIPAGRIHTIGTGILLAEIQQTSDITYRIYDFDRRDANGNARDLHIDQSVEALDYSKCYNPKQNYQAKNNDSFSIVKAKYFETNGYKITSSYSREYGNDDSFRILIITEGNGKLIGDDFEQEVKKGDSLLLPAVLKNWKAITNSGLEFLETFVP